MIERVGDRDGEAAGAGDDTLDDDTLGTGSVLAGGTAAALTGQAGRAF
jgi:hypothetical protein